MAKWISHTYVFGCVCSVMFDSLRCYGLQPASFLCPWDSPGKNTGVGCHFLFQHIHIPPPLPTSFLFVTTVRQVEFSVLYIMFPTVVSFIIAILFYNFPGAQAVKNLPAVQETWVWYLDRKDPLEKGMATHSSILAWRISWTEGPGRLQFMGSQRSWTQLSD